MERPADGGWKGLDAGSLARRRRVGKLPRYVLSRRAWARGRGVRFILHAEGRAANRGINREWTTAKACLAIAAASLLLIAIDSEMVPETQRVCSVRT